MGCWPGQFGGLSNVIAIANGGDHNLALEWDGTITGWGDRADRWRSTFLRPSRPSSKLYHPVW